MNIDKTPPVLVLDPGSGQTLDLSHSLLLVNFVDSGSWTGVPPVDVSGIDLSTLQIKLGGVDETANFYKYPAGAASDGVNLAVGSHTWSATIADLAGNVASNTVTFTATGTTNANAPVISNVNLGAGGITVLPASSEVWVQGKVTGTGTTVAVSINGGEPILMNRRGEDFGYLLPLDAGTNVIAELRRVTSQHLVYRVDNGRGTGQFSVPWRDLYGLIWQGGGIMSRPGELNAARSFAMRRIGNIFWS